MIKSDILFSGYYGQLNTGDDAFVEVAAWGAKHIWGKENNRFLAIKSNLPTTIVQANGYPVSIPKSYGLQKKVLLSNCNYLISAGGSTIHSELPITDAKKIALDLKMSGKKLKVGAIGVSIGPFRTVKDETAVNNYLKSIDFIALRDQRSYDYVKSISNLSYTPVNAFDLAAMLPDIYQYKKNSKYNSNKKIIGISVCPYESLKANGDHLNENRRNENLINLIKELNKKDDIIFRFFVINGNAISGDEKLTKEFINKSGVENYEIVKYSPNTQFIWNSINECNAVISTRLHGAIFACFGRTPFVLIEYHKKCADFLDDIGFDKNMRIYDAEFDKNETCDKILSWVNNYSNFNVPIHLDEKVEFSKKNFLDIQIK